jgi:hypothetical protein
MKAVCRDELLTCKESVRHASYRVSLQGNHPEIKGCIAKPHLGVWRTQ